MAVITVSSATALSTALRSAAAGDTIQLTSGNYGQMWIDGTRIFGGEVVITSADPAHPAVIEYLNVRNAQGLAFRQVEIGMEAGASTYLTKPVGFLELKEAVDRALGSQTAD